jgi:integrase/recombinase XerD
MTLSELVAQYVSHKRALGMRFDSEAATLASFCRRVDGNIDVDVGHARGRYMTS